MAFELKHDFGRIDFFGFAQRRFVGFRNRYEFEKKRLAVSNLHEYSIVGYDHRKHVFELLRQEVEDRESQEIRFMSFLEDSQPQYLLLLVADKKTQKTLMLIKQIKKDEQVRDESQQVYSAIETDNHQLTDMIKENWKQGNLQKSRKKAMDNYALLPNFSKLSHNQQQQLGNTNSQIPGANSGIRETSRSATAISA